MRINSLSTLSAFFETLTASVAGIDKLVVLSNGEDAVDEIDAYYEREAGSTTCFLQIAEAERLQNGARSERLALLCSVTIAQKTRKAGQAERLATRDRTLALMLHLIGALEQAVEASQDEVEENGVMDEVDLLVHRNRILPIGKLANVSLQGWYVDLDVTIPANPLLYA